jgi:hypothetical protein
MAVVSTVQVTDKDSIDLSEYNGTYELISKYGEYQNWAKYRIGKDKYSEKDRPVKVTLGDKSTAVATLLAILERLTGEIYIPGKLDVPY